MPDSILLPNGKDPLTHRLGNSHIFVDHVHGNTDFFFFVIFSRDQRKPTEDSQQQSNAGTSSNEMKKSTSQSHTKFPPLPIPLIFDMDINKVLGKIHPS